MMWSIFDASRDCGAVGTRRMFLQAGALGTCGLTLADLLRAEAAAGRKSTRSVINIHLDGGPPQMDMIDPKPDAPSEIRGEFAPISTAIPGLFLSELLPQVARNAGQFAFVRSLVGSAGAHDAFQCQSGYAAKELQSIGGRPAMGCVVGKLKGSPSDATPSFVDMMQGRPLVRNSARPGFLGPSYAPFRPDLSHLFQRELEPGMKNELAAKGANHTVRLTLSEELTVDRLEHRTGLLRSLDRVRREIDSSGMMEAMDRFNQQAVGILTSGAFAAAMDLETEDPRIAARYVPTSSPFGGEPNTTSDELSAGKKLLLARRLVEAGVRCVSVTFSDFDTHRGNFTRMRHLGPLVDHAVCTLVADLSERGLLDDTLIVLWGEFGRTPKINASAGRDHWPQVGMAMLAGGGAQGQVIGATDRYAATPIARPISYQDVFATLYHHLGIDARALTLQDTTGRPQYILDQGRPLRELV